jgi:two-component system sensor histidine kinase KdpD
VGKTFSMLSEAIRRKSRGEDVVIGIVETHGRARTAELAAQIEQVPRRQMEYKGAIFEEMDVDAVLARRPDVVLIDELAHTNVEGCAHPKRFQDVLQILEAEIDVLTTLNVQHVESITPRVQSLTGVTVRETVPDWVLDRADEIVMSDLTPEALVHRMDRGDIYPQERVERALQNFFRRGNLIALREMALQRVTRAVDRTLDDYVTRKQLSGHWQIAERVAVCISSNPESRDLIARGARLAEAINAEFFVLHVENELLEVPENRRRTLEANIQFAENVGARVVRLKGSSIATVTAEYVTRNRITQVIFGRSAIKGWKKYLYYLSLQRFMNDAPHVDVHLVTQQPA